jgi:hypothetical protein
MTDRQRSIGPIGSALRVLLGLALLYIASGANGLGGWGPETYDLILGLAVFPAIMLVVGLVASRYATGPIRLTGPLGIALNLVLIVGLIANPVTGGGATIFYGLTMVLAAWLGQRGCEATVISNLILGRDDQIGCPVFEPIDDVEARLRRRGAPADPSLQQDAR